MGTFNITFNGLIAHIRYGGSTRAVCAFHAGHEPTLIVDQTDVVGSITGFPNTLKGNEYHIEIRTAVTLSPKPTNAPKKLNSFDKRVPSLVEVLTADVDADAKAGKTSHGGVLASLDYAGDVEDKTSDSTLSANACFPGVAVWSGGNPAHLPQCVASTTTFSYDPASDPTISDGTNTVTILKTASIKFHNTLPGNNHFHGFKNLSTATGVAIHTPKPKPLSLCINCQPHTTGSGPDPDLDCSNSRYP